MLKHSACPGFITVDFLYNCSLTLYRKKNKGRFIHVNTETYSPCLMAVTAMVYFPIHFAKNILSDYASHSTSQSANSIYCNSKVMFLPSTFQLHETHKLFLRFYSSFLSPNSFSTICHFPSLSCMFFM